MHRLERVLERSSDKKDHVLARASYITCENRRSDIVPIWMIYRTCLSSIEPAQMHSTELSTTVQRLKHTYGEIEWVIPVLDNFRHFLYTVESRKFEVIGTRDFILKYREFELAYREKNIKMYTCKNDYYQCFSLSSKYSVFMKETSRGDVSSTHTKHNILNNS